MRLAAGLGSRLVRVALAIYLLPVVLIVVAVGLLGLLILGIARVFGTMLQTLGR